MMDVKRNCGSTEIANVFQTLLLNLVLKFDGFLFLTFPKLLECYLIIFKCLIGVFLNLL